MGVLNLTNLAWAFKRVKGLFVTQLYHPFEAP